MAATQAEKDAYRLMRRGTRACRECRRRKIRCLWADESDDICQDCQVHGRDCVKQGAVRGSNKDHNTHSLKVQVTKLESTVEKLARENRSFNATRTTGSETAHAALPSSPHEETDELNAAVLGETPIFALFNNDTLHQKEKLEPFTSESSNAIKFPDPNAPDREKLLSTIANVPHILQVLQIASTWWISWREQHFGLRKTAGRNTLQEFVQSKLSDESPLNVALGLIAIAMSLGQIRPGIDDLSLNLPVPANHIMNYILAAIDQIICDSETYHTQSESILLLMMRAKHHTECNQLRKAWLRIRQSIHCAQRTGFGTPPTHNLVISEEEAEQQRFIAAIYEIDHLISMVLGFPHAKDPAFTDMRAFIVLLNPSVEDESLKMRALRRIVAITAGNINDRNAGIAESRGVQFAESTQAKLEMAADAMPIGWWSLSSQSISGSGAGRYESVMAQFSFWTVQAYLHMPYLIQPSEAEPYRQYRQLCMEGTRNMLRAFNYMRTEPAVSLYMCNCDDFQALLGACILLVGILQDVSKHEQTPPVVDIQTHTDADLTLIEELKDIFRYRVQEPGGGISKQGLAVLEQLTSFLYESDEQSSSPDMIADLSELNINIDKRQKTVMLPYFGTIKVELARKLPKRQATKYDFDLQNMTPPHDSTDSLAGTSSPYGFPSRTNAQNLAFNNSADWASHVGLISPSSALDSYIPPSLNQQPLVEPLNFSPESLSADPINWGQWQNYMFDQELDQDWNPGLHWDDEQLII